VAPKRPFERLRFDVWMALAKAAPVRRDELDQMDDAWMGEGLNASGDPEADEADDISGCRGHRIRTLGTGQLWL